MTAVLQKIAAAGIPKDAVRTLVVSLQQEFDFSNGRQTPRGYLARNIIEVRVDDLARLGDVLGASVSSGATSIHGLQFDLKERTKFEREALTRPWPTRRRGRMPPRRVRGGPWIGSCASMRPRRDRSCGRSRNSGWPLKP